MFLKGDSHDVSGRQEVEIQTYLFTLGEIAQVRMYVYMSVHVGWETGGAKVIVHVTKVVTLGATYIRMCICVYVCMYVCTYVCMYVCVCM